MNKDALLDKISHSTKLPILPDIAIRIMQLNNDPDLYPAKVQAVLSSDPVLAARILQVSNSAMFRRSREVTELGEAVAVLGVQLAMSIATGFVIVDSLRNDEVEGSGFDYDLYWRKSILSAIAANELCAQLKIGSRGELFVAALMQDVGMLVLNNIISDKYAQLVRSAKSHFDLVAFEERVFGLSHAEVGAVLLEKWGLPESIRNAVSYSHALFSNATTFDLTDLQYGVSFSGVLAELWISESVEQEVLNKNIRDYLDKVGDDVYKNTVASILDAIPGANEIFNMQLLSDEQMANVA